MARDNVVTRASCSSAVAYNSNNIKGLHPSTLVVMQPCDAPEDVMYFM